MTSDDGGEAQRWRVIRHLLACRSGHRCEVCGCHLGPDDRLRMPPVREGTVHHRQPHGLPRSDPAADAIDRLLLCCGGRLGGVLGCHGRIEDKRAWALRNGYLVPRDGDPAQVPVVLWSGRRVLLTAVSPEYLPAPGPPYVT